MGGRASKNKGKVYERDLANYLSNLFGEPFTRVPNSGAFVGGQNHYRLDGMSTSQKMIHKGDIIPPDSKSNWVIECKNYAEFPFHKLILDEDIPLLNTWIAQLEECMEPNDEGFLCVKITRKGEFTLHKRNSTGLKYKSYFVTETHKFFETL